MGMTVQRRKDTRTRRVFMHKVADIRAIYKNDFIQVLHLRLQFE